LGVSFDLSCFWAATSGFCAVPLGHGFCAATSVVGLCDDSWWAAGGSGFFCVAAASAAGPAPAPAREPGFDGAVSDAGDGFGSGARAAAALTITSGGGEVGDRGFAAEAPSLDGGRELWREERRDECFEDSFPGMRMNSVRCIVGVVAEANEQ
jgi:hypothetical protein